MEIKRGDVWWWKGPPNHRLHIQEGARPCVVVSNDQCNKASGVVTILPFTTKIKRPYPQQVPIVFDGGVSIALADQITTIPKTELDNRVCKLTNWQMAQIENAILIQLGILPAPREDTTSVVECNNVGIRQTWTEESMSKFLKDCMVKTLPEMVKEYRLSPSTIRAYKVRFEKKNTEKVKAWDLSSKNPYLNSDL